MFDMIKRHEGSYEVQYPFLAIFLIYFILFITALIHNEIIVITKCGLGDKTKLFMEEKVREENLLSSLDADIEIMKRFDTMIELEINNINNEENNENNNQAHDNDNNKNDYNN